MKKLDVTGNAMLTLWGTKQYTSRYLHILAPEDMNGKINHRSFSTITGTKRKHHHSSDVPVLCEELPNEQHKPVRKI